MFCWLTRSLIYPAPSLRHSPIHYFFLHLFIHSLSELNIPRDSSSDAHLQVMGESRLASSHFVFVWSRVVSSTRRTKHFGSSARPFYSPPPPHPNPVFSIVQPLVRCRASWPFLKSAVQDGLGVLALYSQFSRSSSACSSVSQCTLATTVTRDFTTQMYFRGMWWIGLWVGEGTRVGGGWPRRRESDGFVCSLCCVYGIRMFSRGELFSTT